MRLTLNQTFEQQKSGQYTLANQPLYGGRWRSQLELSLDTFGINRQTDQIRLCICVMSTRRLQLNRYNLGEQTCSNLGNLLLNDD